MKKIKTLIIGVFLIMITIGIVFALTIEQLKDARTCDTSKITYIFDKYSDSDQTGYIINSTTGDVIQYNCENGKWVPTQEWADINKIDVETITLDTSFLKPEQYEQAVTCDVTTITYVFDKYDDGAQIGYMINIVSGEATEYRCDKGLFVPTIRWCDENHIDIATIQIGDALKPSNNDESGRQIVYPTIPVVIDKSQEIVVNDKLYNITYITQVQQQIIHCICEKELGCTNEECKQKQ